MKKRKRSSRLGFRRKQSVVANDARSGYAKRGQRRRLMSVHIDRCVCHGRRFVELKRVAAETGARTLVTLSKEADACDLTFGESCGLCHPYVEAMLRDGRVVFTEIITASGDEPQSPSM